MVIKKARKLNRQRNRFTGIQSQFPAHLSSVVMLCFAALLGTSQPASAAQQVYAYASSGIGSSGPAQTASFGTVSSGYDRIEPYASALGRAEASFGILRASMESQTFASSSSLNIPFSASTAMYKDDWLIDKPGKTGTSGTARVRFRIDGTLSSVASGTPDANASTFYNNTWAEARYAVGVGIDFGATTKSQRVYADGRQTGTPFLGIEQEAVVDFVYGQWLSDVTLRINASVVVGGQFSNYTSRSSANLGGTAYWLGFVDVRDSSGNLVTDYNFSSGSGTDFTQAVPEPTSVSLGLLAAAVLASGRRLRRKG